MAITKPTRSMLSTGVSDSSDSTFLTADSSENATFAGNLTVTGNLTVSGTQTVVSSTVETHADPLIELNTGAGSNANDLGFVFERGSTGDNACLIWDESADSFLVGTTTATGTSTGNMTVTAGDFTAGKITVDNVTINGTTIGHTSDTDLMTLADGGLTVAGTITGVTSLTVDDMTLNGSTISDSGDFTIDSGGDIVLDADGGDWNFKDGGTLIGSLENESNNFVITSHVDDADFIIKGQDSTSEITALTLDMSAAGAATFNSGVTLGGNLTMSSHTIYADSVYATERVGHMDDASTYIDFDVDTMVFSTASEAMRIDSSNNVGIGCTAGSRLEVRGAANGTSLAEFSGTDGRGLKIFTQKSNYPTDSGQNDAVVVYNAQDTENAGYPGHVFQYGGNEVLRLQQIESSGATGSVGINNNAPAYTLDVTTTGESNAMRIYQATDAKDLSCVFQNAGTGSGDDCLLSFTTAVGAGDPYLRWNIAGTDSWAMGINNSENDEFQLTNQSTLGATRYWTLFGGNLHFSPDDSDCLIYLGSTGGDFGGNSSHGIRCSGNNFMFNSGNSNFIFEIQGTQEGYINTDGFNNGSDRSLKENIENIQYGLSTVHQLIPRKFDWKVAPDADKNSIGFIAQEVEEFIPEIVSESAADNDNVESIKGLNYGALTAVLVKAIQELDQEVTNKDQRIADLEQRIHTIEQRLV